MRLNFSTQRWKRQAKLSRQISVSYLRTKPSFSRLSHLRHISPGENCRSQFDKKLTWSSPSEYNHDYFVIVSAFDFLFGRVRSLWSDFVEVKLCKSANGLEKIFMQRSACLAQSFENQYAVVYERLTKSNLWRSKGDPLCWPYLRTKEGIYNLTALSLAFYHAEETYAGLVRTWNRNCCWNNGKQVSDVGIWQGLRY